MLMTINGYLRIGDPSLKFRDKEWLRKRIFDEFPRLLKDLSDNSTILVSDIKITGTKAYPVCYVQFLAFFTDENSLRKIKIKHATEYNKFITETIRKSYEIPYHETMYAVYDLKGEYI